MPIKKEELNIKQFVQTYFDNSKPNVCDFDDFKQVRKTRRKLVFEKQESDIKGFIRNYFQKTR